MYIVHYSSLDNGKWKKEIKEWQEVIRLIKEYLQSIYHNSTVYHYDILDKFTEFEDIHVKIESCYSRSWHNEDTGFQVHSYQSHFIVYHQIKSINFQIAEYPIFLQVIQDGTPIKQYKKFDFLNVDVVWSVVYKGLIEHLKQWSDNE